MTREDKNTTKCYCGHTTYCDCDPLVSKQTAVEWLLQRFEDGDMYNVEDAQFIKHQAKEMEKQQIIESYRDGRSDQQSERQSRFYNRMAEQYYNETYGGDK
jgi:hypothetical protein